LTPVEPAFQPPPTARPDRFWGWWCPALPPPRLGHAPEAASALERAVKAIDQQSSAPPQEQARTDWAWLVASRMLAREAEELLAKKGP